MKSIAQTSFMPSASDRPDRYRQARRRLGLRVREEEIEPESTFCDCGCVSHVIGEDVSARLTLLAT